MNENICEHCQYGGHDDQGNTTCSHYDGCSCVMFSCVNYEPKNEVRNEPGR